MLRTPPRIMELSSTASRSFFSYLFTAGVVFFLALLIPLSGSHACPLLQRRGLCAADNATSRGAASGQCGDHAVQCSDSRWQIQFYGEGGWCNVTEFSYEDRVLVCEDADLNDVLSHHDCGLVYSFAPPAPPLPHPTPFQNSLKSGFNVFNCELATYNFSKDVFTRAYNSTGCSGYDLYYSFEYEGQQRPEDARCRKEARINIFEWRVQFDESGRDLTVLSADLQFSFHLCASSSGAVIGGFLLSCMFILYCFHGQVCYLLRKWRQRNTTNVEDFLEQYGSLIPKRFDYWEIKKMTKSFNKSLGHGGYGKVFKGQLGNGRLVAVKLLNQSKGNGEEFVNEVASIGRTYHVNIVTLLGFCSEGRKRALIYEFMPNGSLEKFIFSEVPRDLLGWTKIYEIALGIARGLEYLHRGCKIVHFDIKPQNILLDQDFCPKIADFGLAKLCRPKESVLSMAGTRGTVGYIAPEVFSRNFGAISTKSDVYSYGMMLMEMVSQRKNVDAGLDSTNEVYFPHFVYEQLVNLGHPGILELTDEMEEIAKKMIVIGLWCIQTNPRSRPSMSNVVEMLQGNSDGLQLPPKPYLTSPTPSYYTSNTHSI
ncbi:hypothetical protein Taro_037518 [Colocasia esculenta]|uniref:non-specific serine/threonine protein kinase n=1 Tax=Colocasia esculenta TaxID=4460 RepID=A0A843W4D1_COLES|nr:hypothetical protein [Colocasia esculenta]